MQQMIPLSKEFTVNTNPGLDIRPAAMIVQTLLPVRSAVVAEANEERVDAKSVLELCCLHAARGTKIKFTATGAEADRALHAVQHLFATQFRAPRPRRAQPGQREGKKHPGDFHLTTCRWQRTGGFQETNDITELCTIE